MSPSTLTPTPHKKTSRNWRATRDPDAGEPGDRPNWTPESVVAVLRLLPERLPTVPLGDGLELSTFDDLGGEALGSEVPAELDPVGKAVATRVAIGGAVRDLLEAVDRLPAREREALLRFHLKGETLDDAGRSMNCSGEWVRKLSIRGTRRVVEDLCGRR